MSRQRLILAKIKDLKDRLEDSQCMMASLHDDCEQLNRDRDAAIQRAEKAEREVERLGEIVTECDGVECVKHDFLVRMAVKEEARLRKALAFYGNPDNWRFTHDKENNLLWITSLGPDYAIEILNGIEEESSEEKGTAHAPGDGTLVIKKA